MLVLPNTKIGVFRVMGLKILGRLGKLNFFSREKNLILCILKGISPFKMHNFFFRKPEKNSRFHQ